MKNKKLKNLDALIIVGVIFIALGCRCQSSLFGNNKSSNSETNTNVAVNTLDNSPSPSRPNGDIFGGGNANVSPPRRTPDIPRGGEVERGGSGTTADKLTASVGNFRLQNKEKGDPVRDGFTGASEVWKSKYTGDQNETVQYAVAQFATASAAEQNLKQTHEEFKKRGGQVSEIDTASDNDRNPIGLVFSIKGKGNLVYYWTSGRYVYAIIGPEKPAEEFFAATETPLEP
jgi:hypothetical protein